MKDNVWFVKPGTKELVTPYERYEAARPIVTAQPFTVSMVAAVVAEDLDGWFRGGNDILILTKSAMGEQPLVERIHFYEGNIEKGFPIQNIFADSVFITEDYNGVDKLWLEVNVVEVDTSGDERKTIVKACQSLAATAGAVFPAMLPYAFGASAAAGLIDKLLDLLEENTYVVRVPFALYPGDSRPGKAPLQTGTYVTFAGPQDPTGFTLQANGLLSTDGNPSPVSYAVFDVAPVKRVSPKFVISQKVATLLTQIHNDNPATVMGTIEFLSDTLTSYSNFKKLTRYLELKEKIDPTAEEMGLMTEIEKTGDLKPFLPK
jgi:hypothetical protein